MGLKLNKLNDFKVIDELARDTKLMEKILENKPADDSNAKRFERYYSSLGGYSFDMGACLYQQEQSTESIKPHLELAASSLIKMHTLRGDPAPNASRNAWTYEKALNLVVCFGTLEERKLCATIAEPAYRNPPRQDNETIAAYVGVLGQFIATEELEPNLLKDLLERASAANATTDVANWVLPAVKGLQALISLDALALNAAIESLIKTHALYAQKDDFFSKSPNGFLCMPGLMLAKLGSEKKLACTVKSDYLPLQLIGGVKMSDRFELYIVDSEALPTELPDVDDIHKYRTLVKTVQSVGAKWGTIALSERDFAEGLERLDKKIEGKGFLPVLSFNNSPGNLLGDYGDCPCFGYFTPEMVEVILEGIKLIDPAAIDQIQDEPSAKIVLDVYESVAAEAVRFGYAIAVLHAIPQLKQ